MAQDAGPRAVPGTSKLVGTAGDAARVYVPHMDARQYVALRAEPAAQPVPREETWRRYCVANEALLRALDEQQWRHPARRAE